MSSDLHPFYLVIDSTEWLERFLPLGLKQVLLRIKNEPEEDIATEISEALAMCEDHTATLIVNDHWQLASEAGVDWVHLGQGDLDDLDILSLREDELRIGVSTYDDLDLERIQAIFPDYVSFGSIYNSNSRPGVISHGPERLSFWREKIDCPLIAFGGITIDRAPEVYGNGADIICISDDVLKADDPESQLEAWLKTAEQYGPKLNQQD